MRQRFCHHSVSNVGSPRGHSHTLRYIYGRESSRRLRVGESRRLSLADPSVFVATVTVCWLAKFIVLRLLRITSVEYANTPQRPEACGN